MLKRTQKTLLAAAVMLAGAAPLLPAAAQQQTAAPALRPLQTVPGAQPRNVVFILTDDHRYDALGFLNRSFVVTPHMDSMARNGVHLPNAFVTTALCSPSRASILTGLYAHRHKVVDNNNPIPAGTIFFPQFLQRSGYQTALVGKWHMGGDSDEPQPGFDHWVSFRGQGTYRPGRDTLNINGRRVPQRGYITDELTDHALQWLQGRDQSKPFFLYLSHKGVHSEFHPPERYQGSLQDREFKAPLTMDMKFHNDPGRPMWVKNQRNSWHGVDFPYHSELDVGEYFKRYAETLRGVDDSVGRVLAYLRDNGLMENTLVVYMGDNGFAFGEHGLIDKRTAYEESMRVPLLVQGAGLPAGTTVNQVVANIDIGPTVLEAAGLRAPEYMDGESFLPLLQGRQVPWRTGLLYEYYWERTFPHTPTIHALRGDRYKYVRYHGIWDTDELFDLQADPLETRNLIRSPEHQQVVQQMNRQLFQILAETDGSSIPLWADRTFWQANLRSDDGPEAAEFPPHYVADEQRNPTHP